MQRLRLERRELGIKEIPDFRLCLDMYLLSLRQVLDVGDVK